MARVFDPANAFTPTAGEPYRRRGTDAVRIMVAALIVAFLASRVGRATPAERAIFELFNTLPASIKPFASAIYRVGALWAVGLVTIAALGGRRWRLARDLSLSGVIGWLASRATGLFVSEGVHGARSAFRFGVTPTFPLVHMGVVVAILAAASPYVSRPVRRIGQVFVVGIGASALYLGTAYPRDLVAGLALGWGVAAGIHLIFGSPAGRPTVAQVASALADIDFPISGLKLAAAQPAGASIMTGTGSSGAVRVKLIGRDEADAQLLNKVWRFILYRDSASEFYFTRAAQLHHEAFTMLLAREAGVRTPAVLLAGTAGPGIAVEIETMFEGVPLAQCDPAKITDEVLQDAWQQLVRLHAARISHGGLDGRRVIISDDPKRPTAFVDFSRSHSPTSSDNRSADVAELLLATSLVTDETNAVNIALSALGAETLVAALPLLQQAAISHDGRVAAGTRKELGARLDRLRHLAASATYVDEPPLLQLQRVRTSSVALALGALIGVGSLLSQIGNPSLLLDSIRRANASWIVAAFILSMATGPGYGIALMGSVSRKLPILPNFVVQMAGAFSNLAIPLGSAGLQVRFLQKQGVSLAAALAGGGILCGAMLVAVQLAVLPVALWLSPRQLQIGGKQVEGITTDIGYVVAVAVVALSLIVFIPLLRRRVLPPVTDAALVIWKGVHSPRQLSLLLLGNFWVVILNGLCLLACLEAFSHPISIWPLLAVSNIISTLSALVPVPGAGTAVSSIGLSGALVALGVPEAVAIAAVLTNQLVTSYLPAIPGWFATSYLVERDYL